MQWQYNPYVLLLFISAVTAGVLAYLAFKRRSSPGGRPLIVLALGAAVWSLGYGFELGADAQSTKVLWAKIQYAGIATIPTAWLAVTLDYTGRCRWLAPRYLPFWAIVPLATLLLALTNEAHGLIWRDITLTPSGSLLVLDLDHGVAFWVYSAHSYLLLLIGSVILADVLLPSLRLYWGQAVALMSSALAPWVASLAFVTDVNPIRPLDPVPFAFIFSSLALFWAITRFRFLDIRPVARNRVFATMSVGVFVLDVNERIADCNPLGAKYLARL